MPAGGPIRHSDIPAVGLRITAVDESWSPLPLEGNMPLRIKCRCGQELVLRYSEWTYILSGILLLGMAVNAVALCVLYFRLNSIEASLRGRAGATALLEERAALPLLSPGGSRDEEEGGGEPGGALSVAERGEAPSPARQPQAEGELMPTLRREDRAGWAGSPPTAGASVSLLEQLELLEPPPVPPEELAPIGLQRLVEGPPLLRLMLLRMGAAEPLFPWAFLLDPDPALRRAALEQVLELPPPEGKLKERIVRFLLPAVERLREKPQGRGLLERLGIAAPAAAAPASQPAPDGAIHLATSDWKALQEESERLLASLPQSRQLLERFAAAEARGIDLLLAVDSTKSMEAALHDIKPMVSWLLPALGWGLPGTRIALLLYKDEVEEVIGFSSTPAKDVLPRLLSLLAEGGGDVPEGLLAALQGALELGRFDWREEAMKHVIFLGDGPPRYSELRALKHLAAAAHRQGGFAIHALGLTPREGRTSIPFFSDLARSGGGHTATCDAETLGVEILTCLLGEANRESWQTLRPRLEQLFVGG
jgi:hypothetical protein